MLDRERAEATARRRDAVRRTSGALTGAYEPGYLEGLGVIVVDAGVLIAHLDESDALHDRARGLSGKAWICAFPRREG